MSKLDELIQQYCPDGVAYKKIGDIAIDIFRGSGITRDQVTESGTPCVRYGEIYTSYGIWFDECISHTDPNSVSNAQIYHLAFLLKLKPVRNNTNTTETNC